MKNQNNKNKKSNKDNLKLYETAKSFDLKNHPGLTPKQFYKLHPNWPKK